MLMSLAMQYSSTTSNKETRIIFKQKVLVDRVEIRLKGLLLKEPFETGFGRIDSRQVFLVSAEMRGQRGWGEAVAAEEPRHSYETVGTAFHVIRDFLGPALMLQLLAQAQCFAPFRGHNMAKAGLELAYVDLLAWMTNQSLSARLGGTRTRIRVGVSLSIQPR